MKSIFSKNLCTARKLSNLTQEEVAKVIFKTRQGYAKYENGEAEPDLATTILLCDLFGITDLIGFINRDYFKEAAA